MLVLRLAARPGRFLGQQECACHDTALSLLLWPFTKRQGKIVIAQGFNEPMHEAQWDTHGAEEAPGTAARRCPPEDRSLC